MFFQSLCHLHLHRKKPRCLLLDKLWDLMMWACQLNAHFFGRCQEIFTRLFVVLIPLIASFPVCCCFFFSFQFFFTIHATSGSVNSILSFAFLLASFFERSSLESCSDNNDSPVKNAGLEQLLQEPNLSSVCFNWNCVSHLIKECLWSSWHTLHIVLSWEAMLSWSVFHDDSSVSNFFSLLLIIAATVHIVEERVLADTIQFKILQEQRIPAANVVEWKFKM